MDELVEPGLDAERAAVIRELVSLQSQIHDLTVALVGPAPLPPDLTMQQVRVLGFVAKEPGLSGQRLGELLGVSAPTASGLVDRLVEKGLVSRSEDREDRRVRRLHPTADGLAMIRRMDSMFSRSLRVVAGRLDLADLETMRQATQVMLDALRKAVIPGVEPQ